MAGSLNKAQIIGNVGKDPEIRSMQSGDKVANFSIATSESWKDKRTGDRIEKTEWHKVVCFNQGIVKVIENYVQKGTKVYIEGQIETKKWQDKNGDDRYTTEIIIKPFNGTLVLLGGKNKDQDDQDDHDPETGEVTGEAPASDDFDDEIPY